jgi:hypothetical protein
MAANGRRKALRGLGVLLALGLSVAAVLLVVFGKDAKTIRVGVILGAWGLMFGGLSLYPRRNVAIVPTTGAASPVTSTALEPRDDAAARREFERVLEAMLHRELDRGLRSELDSLRGEMAGLRGEVGQAMRNQVSLERVEKRMVGADFGELQDDVRRRGPAVEPKAALLVSPSKPPNSDITEVMAAVRESAPPPPAPLPAPAPPPPPAPVKSAAPAPTPRPAWSPSSVDVPSLVFNPPPPPAPPVRPPVTPTAGPLGARRVPPVGPPRPMPPPPAPTQPAPAPAPVPQFAVPGPPVWTGPSSVDLSAPPRPPDSTVPRPASSPSFGNGTSMPPRPASSPAPQEMRWPWQEETRRATETATPLAPKLPPVPSVTPPPWPAAAVPPPTPTAEAARPAITRSDPFAGLPRLTPVSELDLPELLPDLPPPPPPAPRPTPAAVPPPVPAAPTVPTMPAPGLTRPAGRPSHAPPEAPPGADGYVGRRRAGY